MCLTKLIFWFDRSELGKIYDYALPRECTFYLFLFQHLKSMLLIGVKSLLVSRGYNNDEEADCNKDSDRSVESTEEHWKQVP